MKIRNIFEELSNKLLNNGDDHEASMALTDLRSIAHRAAALAKYMEENNVQELEGWVQAKITKSADYINAVYDNYMFDSECESCGEMNEALSTCCGRCGHMHVKGTPCPKPYLTGNRHCRNRS